MLLKRLFCLVTVTASIFLVAAAPVLTLNSIPNAKCIAPSSTLYEKQIYANGTIEAKVQREIYLDAPIIASEVHVEVGDYVTANQVIATVDRSASQSVLENSISSASVLDSLSSLPQGSTDELLSAFAALQGFDPSLASELAQTYGGLAEQIGAQQAGSNTYLYIPQEITAPMDGIITSVSLKSGVLSRSGTPLFVLEDKNSLIAMVSVSEAYSAEICEGDPVILEGPGFGGNVYAGVVEKIYPTARKASSLTSQENVVDVEITIENPDEYLKSGFSTRAKIITGSQREMLTIPYSSVLQDHQNQEYVYLIEGSRPVRRDIETGLELYEGVEVLQGLTEQDLILADASLGENAGHIRLQKGEYRAA